MATQPPTPEPTEGHEGRLSNAVKVLILQEVRRAVGALAKALDLWIAALKDKDKTAGGAS